MCLYPKLLPNRKYLPNKKNNYTPPECKDERIKYVAIGCGNCIECRQQKARAWTARLNYEIEQHKYNYFVTLTFSPDKLKELAEGLKTPECNATAGRAIRLFLERWRKKHKKSLRHWLITELGQTESERIHLHGLIFSDEEIPREKLEHFWSYGFADNGKYVNAKTINYITKYVTKIDEKHKKFKPQIFASGGIGKGYTDTLEAKFTYKYKDHATTEYITLKNGQRINMPIYWRNKLFTEDEREKLWTDRLDKGIIYVRGIPLKMNSIQDQRLYMKILKTAQEDNIKLGYGDDTNIWKKEDYNITLRMLNKGKRKTK